MKGKLVEQCEVDIIEQPQDALVSLESELQKLDLEAKELEAFDDMEASDVIHQKADEILLEMLTLLGKTKEVDMYRRIKKNVGFYYI